MLVHVPLQRSTSPDLTDSNGSADRDLDTPREGDPFRQLFHRHANHVNGAQTHHMKAGLRSRLFAEKPEL